MLSQLTEMLNSCPTWALPTWVLDPSEDNCRQAQHLAETQWDDCGNLAGSVLMLILLRPMVFGMPWMAPVRIFGVPPPTMLLDLDDNSASRLQRTRDNHRTNCVEGLLGHFRATNDVERGDFLQDCWWVMASCIRRQGWTAFPPWQIARCSLTIPRGTALMT